MGTVTFRLEELYMLESIMSWVMDRTDHGCDLVLRNPSGWTLVYVDHLLLEEFLDSFGRYVSAID
jgi:hypothetical protein